MGQCEYQNGSLNRIDPIEYKHYEDIRLGKKHLEIGYPDISKKKTRLQEEIVTLHNQINDTITKFHEIIISSIPSKFKSGENIVSETNPKFLPFYYQRHTFSFLFEHIDKEQNVIPSKLLSLTDRKIHVNTPNGAIEVPTLCVYIGLRDMALGNESDLEQYLTISNELVKNTKLIELVQKYRKLKTQLEELNIEGYYEDIDNLWNGIYENGDILEGKEVCRYCPKHGFLDYF
jgi:hypothetical protein